MIKYQKNLLKLQENRRRVPMDLLKTKYRKSYNQLIHEIENDTKDLMVSILFDGLKFNQGDEDELYGIIDRANQIIEEEKKAGTVWEIRNAIFVEYNIKKAIDIAIEKICPRIMHEAYAPYWKKHCIIQDDGIITNDIIHMCWRPDYEIWEKQEDNMKKWTLMLPPACYFFSYDFIIFDFIIIGSLLGYWRLCVC